MGDKALSCFLGCCVQLLQVLMEVLALQCSLSQLLNELESQKDVGALGNHWCFSHRQQFHTCRRQRVSQMSTLWTKKTQVSL